MSKAPGEMLVIRAVAVASFVVLLALALPAGAALAADLRQGDRVVIGPMETVNDDLYVFGRDIEVQGTVNGDVIAGGGNVRISGPVAGDVLLAGGTLSVAGPIGGSVRAMGGVLTVDGGVAEDLVFAGGQLTTTAAVNRDALLALGQGALNGAVGRNVLAGVGGTLTLANRVGGNARVQAGRLELTSAAFVGGNLTYTSDAEAQIAPGATVQGRVERTAPPEVVSPAARAAGQVIGWFQTLVGLFILGTIFVLLFPAFTRRTAETIGSAPWPSLGIGFLTVVAVPIAALIVLLVGLVIGGWWLALLLLALTALALSLGYVTSGLFVGRFVLDRLGQRGLHALVALLLGLVLLLLLGVVPFLGPLVGLAAVLFGLGALVITAVRTRQQAGVEAPVA